MPAVLGMLWTVLSGVTLVTVNDSIETLRLNSNLISLIVLVSGFGFYCFSGVCVLFLYLTYLENVCVFTISVPNSEHTSQFYSSA